MTVIDTPVFPGFSKDKLIYEVIDELKNEIKFVHVFILVLNDDPAYLGEQTILHEKVESRIRLFSKVFGKDFWNNVVLEATHWKWYRQQNSISINEDEWTEKWRTILKDKFDIPVSNKSIKEEILIYWLTF